MTRLIDRLVLFSTDRPWRVILLALLVAAAAVVWTTQRFAITTDTSKLISPTVRWRQNEIALDRAFPQRVDLILAVIDGRTPESADAAADRLVEALGADPHIRNARRPDGGPFFDRNGLVFASEQEFRKITSDIVRQQPFLSMLATDTSIRGVLDTISIGLGGVRSGEATLKELEPALKAVAAVLEESRGGSATALSWQTLVSRAEPGVADLRRLVVIQPVLDFTALQPGADAIDAVRATARQAGIDAAHGLRLRLTGPAPLADEEFATIAEGAAVNTLATIGIVLGLLFLALKSWRLIAAVMATLLSGLAITAGLGLVLVGDYNLISVAFAVLFVGLGVDFSIQVAVRYREERSMAQALPAAVRGAVRGVQHGLSLAAASTAAGFFSFLPTSFRGVSELGVIAGCGMLIACFLSITLLPALTVVLRPGEEERPVGFRALAGADHWIERRRWPILAGTAVLFLAGLPLLFRLHFDSNPMNLRSAKVESVATFLDLAKSPDTAPSTIDILAPGVAVLPGLVARLQALPEVGRVTSLLTFVPPGQEERLASLQDTAFLLDTVLDPVEKKPPPAEAEVPALARAVAADLRRTARAQTGEGEKDSASLAAKRLATALESFSSEPPEARLRAETALTEGVDPFLNRIRLAFQAETVTEESLPAALRADWVAADGSARIEVAPKGDGNDPAVMLPFIAAVRAVAPDASGLPVTIVESGRTVVESFVTAAALALLLITIILFAVLRRVWDVAMTLLPLVVAVLMSLQTAVLIGLPLNFANIIALPLMCGVSVAFHIYYVIAWRQGVREVLASSLTRAILFSALATATAFGSLSFSSHPGTASMGQLLALSLFFTLAAAFVLVPACLGPPPESKDESFDRV